MSKITIVDAAGRSVYRQNEFNSSTVEVDVSAWSKGIYFITIQNLNGQLTTEKLIKN